MTLVTGTDHLPGSRMSTTTIYRRTHVRSSGVRLAAAILVVGVAVACTSDKVIAPSGPKVSVCHTEAAVSSIGEIFLSELPEHRRNGDYVARLEVSRTTVAGDSIHFARITDALAAARAGRLARNESETAACRITIAVAPGTFTGSTAPSADPAAERFPLVIDVPNISVVGALKMSVDGTGRAMGTGEGSDATTLTANPALIVVGGSSQAGASEELFVVNGHPTGSKGNGAVIEGFVLQNGRAPDATVTGGQGVLSMRVRDLVIRGNRFQGSFTEAIDLRASSGLVDRNHFSGQGNTCDVCLAGPGDYDARNNRLIGPGGAPGVFIVPAVLLPIPDVVEQYTLPSTALVTATVTNNEVRAHLSKPVGTGIRVGAGGIGAPNVAGTSKVVITGNASIGNTFGMIFDAAFPAVGSTLRGDMDITTSGNTISQSCQNDLLVSFTRHASGLGLVTPFPSYLKSSTYSITSAGDLPLDKAWVAHPAGYGNTLILNGQTMPNGNNTAYAATRVCP